MRRRNLLALLSFLMATPICSSAISAQPTAAFLADGRHHGQLIIARENTSCPSVITVIDLLTGKVIREFTHPAFVSSGAGRNLAVDTNGHLWVMDNQTDTVFVFDRLDRFVRSVPISKTCANNPGGTGFRGMAFGPRGTLFIVAGWNSGSVNYAFEVEPETGEVLRCVNVDQDPMVAPRFEMARIGAASDGNLYITEYGANYNSTRIGVMDPDTMAITKVVTSGSFPSNTNLLSIAVLPGGSIVVSEGSGQTGQSSLWRFDATQTNCSLLATYPSASGEWDAFAVANGSAYSRTNGCIGQPGWIVKTDLLTGAITPLVDVGTCSGVSMVVRH